MDKTAIVMLSGSLGVSKLSKEVKDTLDTLINKNVNIVIGDAIGADKCMQEYLYSKGYSKVTVYHIAKTCRTNIGKWARVSVPIGKGAYTPYAYKDIAMCEVADYLLAVMNKGTSTRGTSDNIKRFKKNKRFYKVLYI